MNGNRIRSITCGSTELVRGRDYHSVGSVLALTPAFAKSLINANARTQLLVQFTGGADVRLKLNANTSPCLRLYNARRNIDITHDEMALPYGYRENSRAKAIGGDYAVTFYEDWLFRGDGKAILIKDGQTIKLPSTSYRSLKVKKLR